MKKHQIVLASTAGFLLLVCVALGIVCNNPQASEAFATSFSRWWVTFWGNVFGVLPFSAYELFLICAIVGLVVAVVFLVRLVKGRRWSKLTTLLLALTVGVLGFVNVYTATASVCYNRANLPSQVYTTYTQQDVTYQEVLQLANDFVDELNNAYLQTEHDETGNVVFPFSFQELCQMLNLEYQRLDGNYFSNYQPNAKRIANKTIMSHLHIVGVFFAPFGEVNVSGNENSMYLPFTLAHEMAHSKGVMRESDANKVATYVLLTSQNVYLRYSALVHCMNEVLHLVKLFPNSQADYSALCNKVEKGVFVELENYRKFYEKYSLLDDVGEFFNDLYLKLQKQEGTGSYNDDLKTEDTGNVDNDGNNIVVVINFSDTQNSIIMLHKRALLKTNQ